MGTDNKNKISGTLLKQRTLLNPKNLHAKSQLSSSYSLRSQRSYGQTDMARSTRLVILIKNIYTLWGRNAIDCQIPVTQLRRV